MASFDPEDTSLRLNYLRGAVVVVITGSADGMGREAVRQFH